MKDHGFSEVPSDFAVCTKYGWFRICKECKDKGHLGPYLLYPTKLQEPQRQETPCQCEHDCHWEEEDKYEEG